MDLQDKLAALVVSVAGDVKALLMALANKQDKLNSGTSIKTINGESVLGAGDLVIAGGGAGLTLFEESRSVASPNATVPVHALNAIGAETNIDFVIGAKGTGAILAQAPDGTTAGGAKRGSRAVDLQRVRNTQWQVAQGAVSFTVGGNNTASGVYSIALGSTNIANSNFSIAIGSSNNATAVAASTQAVAIGAGNSATGNYSMALGTNNISSGLGSHSLGYGCVASGSYALAMGASCTATHPNAVAIGISNIASATSALALGSGTRADGQRSTALGWNTTTRGTTGAVALGLGSAGLGTAQMRLLPLMLWTEGATSGVMSAEGYSPLASSIPVLPNNSVYSCRIRVIARDYVNNMAKSWSGTALIKRGANAASTTLVGSSITSDFGDSSMDACSVGLSANTTLGGLNVDVVGGADLYLLWVAQVETVEAA